jgi:hypothetical protein
MLLSLGPIRFLPDSVFLRCLSFWTVHRPTGSDNLMHSTVFSPTVHTGGTFLYRCTSPSPLPRPLVSMSSASNPAELDIEMLTSHPLAMLMWWCEGSAADGHRWPQVVLQGGALVHQQERAVRPPATVCPRLSSSVPSVEFLCTSSRARGRVFAQRRLKTTSQAAF